MNWYTQAGPQPDTQLAASMRASGTASSRPAGPSAEEVGLFLGGDTGGAVLDHTCPTEAGVLGMMRMTG